MFTFEFGFFQFKIEVPEDQFDFDRTTYFSYESDTFVRFREGGIYRTLSEI